MGNRRRISKRCATCGAQCSAYMCGNCARELRELLIGSKDIRRGPSGRQVGQLCAGQPGIIWYCERLKEQAYRQSRLGVQIRSCQIDDDEDDGITGAGYALLVDRRAIDLLARIKASLCVWEDVVLRLCGPQSDEQGTSGVGMAVRRFDSAEARRARFLANNVKTIRLRCANAHRIHTDMLSFAKQAYTVINRPPDNFCGKCSAVLKDGKPCATMLYTVERNETTVACQRCRSEYDVEKLRTAMRDEVRDMLFSGDEIRKLMATSLSDPISKSMFYKLLSDGRLIARGTNGDGQWLFTYADICEARDKPDPTKHKVKVHK